MERHFEERQIQTQSSKGGSASLATATIVLPPLPSPGKQRRRTIASMDKVLYTPGRCLNSGPRKNKSEPSQLANESPYSCKHAVPAQSEFDAHMSGSCIISLSHTHTYTVPSSVASVSGSVNRPKIALLIKRQRNKHEASNIV